MASMYETIMELPLFKGIGEEQLSSMLEKTSVEFVNFHEGDVITRADDKVETLDFVLSGKVSQIYSLRDTDLKIEAIIGRNAVIGALNLYGLYTTYGCKSVALGRVSLLRIRKDEYMDILQSDSIYILNYVNFLSAGAQKASAVIQKGGEHGAVKNILFAAFAMTTRLAETVMICGTDRDIARYCGMSERLFLQWKEESEANKSIKVNPGVIIIKSPDLEF